MPPNPLVKKGDTTYLRLIWEELFNRSGVGSAAGVVGAPIAGATIIVAAPQVGDTVEGTFETVNPATGLTEEIWFPAIGDPMLSSDPTARNGIHPEAQSVHVIARLPQAILALDTLEAWDLKNIAAFACMDGGTPDPTYDGGVRYVPVGGAYSKAWLPIAMARELRAISRWQPSAGQLQPYPNYRLIGEFVFFREPFGPIFEPSLLFTIGGDADSTTTGSTQPANPVDPITMSFPANATESLWTRLPASSTKFLGLQIPASTGASTMTFRIREEGDTGEGLPLLATSVNVSSPGYIGGSTLDSLLGLSYLLGGLHEIKGVLDVGSPTTRDFIWHSSGIDSSTSEPPTTTTLQFPANATESGWVALPDSANKFLGLKIPEAIWEGATLTFALRNVGDTGDGSPLLGTAIALPATGGYIGAEDVSALIGLSYALGGRHELKGILSVGPPAEFDISLFTP